MLKFPKTLGRDFWCGDEHRVLAAASPRKWNIDFQSVRPVPKAFGADLGGSGEHLRWAHRPLAYVPPRASASRVH